MVERTVFGKIPTPLHEDASLTDDWWKLQGCDITGDAGIKLPGFPVTIYRNYIRDARGRYKGYVFVEQNRQAEVTTVLTTIHALELLTKIKQQEDSNG
jgi:hypothetical protein